MDFATAVDRVRDDFIEMPTLELTVAQAVRLWHLGVDDCRFVLDALVDAGFLQWTSRWTIVRSAREPFDMSRGKPFHVAHGLPFDIAQGAQPRDVPRQTEHIRVRARSGRNKSVGL